MGWGQRAVSTGVSAVYAQQKPALDCHWGNKSGDAQEGIPPVNDSEEGQDLD
jgi:hypothetical protein